MHNAFVAGIFKRNYKNELFTAGKRVFNVMGADLLVFGPYVIMTMVFIENNIYILF